MTSDVIAPSPWTIFGCQNGENELLEVVEARVCKIKGLCGPMTLFFFFLFSFFFFSIFKVYDCLKKQRIETLMER